MGAQAPKATEGRTDAAGDAPGLRPKRGPLPPLPPPAPKSHYGLGSGPQSPSLRERGALSSFPSLLSHPPSFLPPFSPFGLVAHLRRSLSFHPSSHTVERREGTEGRREGGRGKQPSFQKGPLACSYDPILPPSSYKERRLLFFFLLLRPAATEGKKKEEKEERAS